MDLNKMSIADIVDAANRGELTADGYKDIICKDGTVLRLVVLGTHHDVMEDGNTATITFGIRDCLPGIEKCMNDSWTNEGESQLERWLNEEWVNNLPDELLSRIVPVKKKTAHSGLDSTIDERLCRAFLPSEIEVFGKNYYSSAGEGRQYDHFKDWHNRVKSVYGESGDWWSLRSPYSGTTRSFCIVNGGGSYSNYGASTSNGVSPCFAIN